MDLKNAIPEDAIGNFVEDEVYYQVKKYKSQVEKVTWAIYIFATIISMFYILFFLINTGSFNWLNFGISALFIALYFCLASYSSHKPFTAFICTIGVICLVTLLQIFTSENSSVPGLITKVAMIVYIIINLEAAKKVQDYENKYPMQKRVPFKSINAKTK